MRLIMVGFLLCSQAALAETLLCVADAGAIVEDGDGRPASAAAADVTANKYVLTRQNGSLVVKELGKDYALFNDCVSPYLCQRSPEYAGAFVRTEDGRFSVTWISRQGNRDQWIVAKGRCSQL